MPKHQDILAFVDSKNWTWTFIQQSLVKLGHSPLRLPAAYCLYDSWTRLAQAPFIIIHWECKERSGGAIIEEIKAIAPDYPVGYHVVVITTNPTHEDVIYLSELGVAKVVTLQNNPASIAKAERELSTFLRTTTSAERGGSDYHTSILKLAALPAHSPPQHVAALQQHIGRALTQVGASNTARSLDLEACLAFLAGDASKAESLWYEATDKNPNYFRAYHNLSHCLQLCGRYEEAFTLLRKLQQRNRSHIARLVSMGELQVKLASDEHALHYFQSALVRDRYCSGALNGLAEIYFRRGDLDQSRDCLSRSYIAADIAAKLNGAGVDLVKQGRYEEALEHYIKAQYVLPQQEKSPMLFYNIGLCYSRWGKHASARQYLEIALIKEPGYEKAQKLLAAINKLETQAPAT